jgi:hypothetical protein
MLYYMSISYHMLHRQPTWDYVSLLNYNKSGNYNTKQIFHYKNLFIGC